MRRRALRALITLILGIGIAGLAVTPAHAAGAGDLTALRALLTGCTGTVASPTAVELTAHINEPTEQLDIPCSVVLDLEQYTLTLRRVEVTPSMRLTVRSSPDTGSLVVNSTVADEAAIAVESAQFYVESGSVYADGHSRAAGIGGDYEGSGGNVNISGGTVDVYAGPFGAGIGGGFGALGSQVFIHGGILTVRAWSEGAAIGPGDQNGAINQCVAFPWPAGPGSILITAGTVNAFAAHLGAGIGSTREAEGPDITIQGGTVTAKTQGETALGGPGSVITITGGTVSASTSAGVSVDAGAAVGASGVTLNVNGGTLSVSTDGGVAVGSLYAAGDTGPTVTVGTGGTLEFVGAGVAFGGSASWGSLTNSGDIKLTGANLGIPAGSVVLNSGRILGLDGNETAGGTVSGGGIVLNSGIVALDDSLVSASVANNNYLLTFVGSPTQTIRLFAPDFATGFRTVPTTAPGNTWNTMPDGTGTNFTSTTTVTADLTLYEVGLIATAALTPDPATTTAGVPIAFTLDARDANNDPVAPPPP